MQKTQERGQVLPLILFMLATGAVLMVVMFNTTQKATDKSIATNAADAAAYSAGVWVSRNLNFMAYTNRAMIANHVAVGHLITYVSWMRYVKATTKNINKIGRFIPYVSYVTNLLEQLAEPMAAAAEANAKWIVPTVDEINGLIHFAQMSAIADLNTKKVDTLMKEVVKTYDSQLRVNQPGLLRGAGADYRSLVEAALLAQRAALLGAAQVISPGEDGGRMRDLVEMSYAGSERWFNNRAWSKRFFLFFKLRKTAETKHSMGEGLTRWQANDKLEYGRYRVGKGWRWSTIGKGQAGSEEFAEHYQGIPGYALINGQSWLSSDEYPLYMDLVALTTKQDRQSTPNVRMSIQNVGTSISGMGRARVYFKKPITGFSGHKEEYANLFNPFWNVKLVEPWPGG